MANGDHLPTMMGFFQPGTSRGILVATMGSRNTVPTVRAGRRSAQEKNGAAPGHQLNVTALCCWQCQGCSSYRSRCYGLCHWGDFHIFFRLNSFTRASSGVMVAHLMPTPNPLQRVWYTRCPNWQHHMRPSSYQRTCRHDMSLTPSPASAGGIAATPKTSHLDGMRRIDSNLVVGLIPVRQAPGRSTRSSRPHTGG